MILSVIIFFVPLLSAIGYFLQYRGIRRAYIWTLITAGSIIVWILLFSIQPGQINPITVSEWFRVGSNSVNLVFELTNHNWILAIAVSSMVVMYLLTAIARLEAGQDLFRWMFISLLLCVFLLSILSSNLWTLLIAWTAMDILYLAFYLVVFRGESTSDLVKNTIFRFVGSGFLVWMTAFYSKPDINLSLSNIPSDAAIFLYIAVFLHSGTIPFQEKVTGENLEGNNLIGFAYEIIQFSSSLFLIKFLPDFNLGIITLVILRVLASFFILVFSYRWIVEMDQPLSHEYAELSILSISVLLVLNNAQASIGFWLAFFVMGWLFQLFHTHKSRTLSVFIILFFIFISNMPFALFTPGIRGFPFLELSMKIIPIFIGHLFLLIGLFRKISESRFEFESLETWYQVIYAAGILFPLITIAVIVFRNLGSLLEEIKFWWVGLAGMIIFILGNYLFRRGNFGTDYAKKSKGFENNLKLDWIYRIATFVEQRIQNLVLGFSKLLEGDGGIIWSFVLIILLISIFQIG